MKISSKLQTYLEAQLHHSVKILDETKMFSYSPLLLTHQRIKEDDMALDLQAPEKVQNVHKNVKDRFVHILSAPVICINLHFYTVNINVSTDCVTMSRGQGHFQSGRI